MQNSRTRFVYIALFFTLIPVGCSETAIKFDLAGVKDALTADDQQAGDGGLSDLRPHDARPETLTDSWVHTDLGTPLSPGEPCSSPAQCLSGRCAPGPEGISYCVAMDQECPRPDRPGVPFGSIYYYGGAIYYCELGRGLVGGAAWLPCGISAAQAKEIHVRWESWRPSLTASLSNPVNYPQVIYDAQLQTASLLTMARYCADLTLLEQLAEVYLLTFAQLSANQRWIDGPTGDEVMLYSTQFLYALANLTHGLARQHRNSGPGWAEAYTAAAAPLIRQTLTRWLSEPSMWMWSVCGLPAGAISKLKAYELDDYVEKKKNNQLKLDSDGPVYCNAITEIEMWAGAAAAELIAAAQIAPALVPLTTGQQTDFSAFAANTLALFESRLSTATSASPLCGGACTYMNFDLGSWEGHPEYPAATWGSTPTAWDFSHARRLVRFMETMYGLPQISQPSQVGDQVITRFSNALVYQMFNGAWSDPGFANFISGTNLPYRTYDPFELSFAYLGGGFGFWARYNMDVKKLNDNIYQALLAGQQLTNMDFGVAYRTLAFLAAMTRPAQLPK